MKIRLTVCLSMFRNIQMNLSVSKFHTLICLYNKLKYSTHSCTWESLNIFLTLHQLCHVKFTLYLLIHKLNGPDHTNEKHLLYILYLLYILLDYCSSPTNMSISTHVPWHAVARYIEVHIPVHKFVIPGSHSHTYRLCAHGVVFVAFSFVF